MTGRKENKNLIVGLDIGTSKIAAIVAEMKPEGGFEVIGMGSSPSRGLKKGVVVNIESTVNAIQRALEEAELMADCKIREVWTGIAGSHTGHVHMNSHGLPDISVTLEDGRDYATALNNGELGNDDFGLHYVGLSGTDVTDKVTGLTLAGESLGAALALSASIDLHGRVNRIVAFNSYDYPSGLERGNWLARFIITGVRLPGVGPVFASQEPRPIMRAVLHGGFVDNDFDNAV